MRSYYQKIEGANLPNQRNPFEGWTEAQIDAHIAKVQYGDFLLTDAVRPSPTLVPKAGYRFDTYHNQESGITIPVIMAVASREALFNLFMDLVGQVEGDTVDVVLETSHDKKRTHHEHFDNYHEEIDPITLRSNLWDFEELLTDDGCTGIAVLNPSIPVEVQFDEHKMLIMYGSNESLYPFEEVLQDAGIRRDNNIRFISEDAHIHSTQEEFVERFKALQILLSGDSDF